MIKAFTHSTRLVPVRNGVFNLEKAVMEILKSGLHSGAKNITVFVYMDGFNLVGLPGQENLVEVGGNNYPLVILPTDYNIIHNFGDVQLKYDT